MWLFEKQVPDDDDVKSLRAGSRSIAEAIGSDCIGAEHLFLSFRSLPQDHSVWPVLRAFEIDLNAFFSELESRACASVGPYAPSSLPVTPRLQGIFRAASRMACREEALYVTPLHLLAAVVHEHRSLPAVVLAAAYRRSHPEIHYERIFADTLLHRLLFPNHKEP